MMSQASSLLVTSKEVVHHKSLSHRSFGSGLVTKNALFDRSVPAHKHNMPDILLW